LAVGYFNQRTGNFLYAFGVLGVALLVSSALTLLFRDTPANMRRDPAIG
jgi:hypothetical protein